MKQGRFLILALLLSISAFAAEPVQVRIVSYSILFQPATFKIFGVEYRNVSTNAQVILEVLAEVDRLRSARGLASNAEALAEEIR